MIDPKTLDEMARKFGEALPPALQGLKNDIEDNFKTTMQYAFSKLDLVTREEFDVQTQVLSKTRAKVEQLEQQLAELEKKCSNK